MWTFRLPQYIGPHHFCRTLVFGFLESACFTALPLLAIDSPTQAQELRLLWSVCLPSGCTALLALAGFALATERYYRAFFWGRDAREAYFRRLWSRDMMAPSDLDRSRSLFLLDAGFANALQKRCPEAVRMWLEDSLPRW